MRLKQYILEYTEDLEAGSIMKTLKSEVKRDYLKAVITGKLLYRGVRKDIDSIEKITPRTNRIPRNTGFNTHKLLDELFLKKFGWKARSEGVFVSGNKDEAYGYGEVYLFFPIGDYKYIWSPVVEDLYLNLDDLMRTANYSDILIQDKEKADAFSQLLDKELIPTYKNDDLKRATLVGNEIMFKCNYYYLVNNKYVKEIHTWLRKEIF